MRKIDLSGLRRDVFEAKITVMCDVDNPLTGKNGATYTYGPQKGADAEALNTLEDGMKNIAALYDAAAGRKVSAECGAGAAGGMGAMLSALLGAELTHGSAAVLNAVGFDALLGDTDLVITGEGQLDASSADNGKAVGEVVKRCAGKFRRRRARIYCCGKASEWAMNIFTSLRMREFFSTIVTDEQPNADGDCDAETRLRLASERMFRCIASSFSVNSQRSGRGMRR